MSVLHQSIKFSDALPEQSMIRSLQFDDFMRLEGRIVRDLPSRKTSQISLYGKSYFIKKHLGVGWAEIFKNLVSGKWPIISARNEMQAIHSVTAAGLMTTPFVAFGELGASPASRRSFLLTADLGDILSIEDICKSWTKHAPSVKLKRSLVREVAKLASVMHLAGVHHRDFYICHICLQRQHLNNAVPPLYVIDLHRAQCSNKLSLFSRIKDIAALYSSVMHVGLKERDLILFCQVYWGADWHKFALPIIDRVIKRALKLDQKRIRKNL